MNSVFFPDNMMEYEPSHNIFHFSFIKALK